MGVYYEEDEAESDKEYEEWFQRNVLDPLFGTTCESKMRSKFNDIEE